MELVHTFHFCVLFVLEGVEGDTEVEDGRVLLQQLHAHLLLGSSPEVGRVGQQEAS